MIDDIDIDVEVVCATCNVSATIADFVKHIDVLMQRAGRTWCLLAVDDSDDDTPDVLRRLAADGYPLRILHRRPAERIGGYSGALVEGFAVAHGRTIAVIDVDFRDTTGVVDRMLDMVAGECGGVDIAIASRFAEGGRSVSTGGWLRDRISRLAARVCSIMFSEVRQVSDPSSGCFAFRREVISHVVFRPERFRVLIEILVRGSWQRCAEVPAEFVGPVLDTHTVTPANVTLYFSRLVRLWLETRVDPARFAERRDARERALEATLPWIDTARVPSVSELSVLVVASEVPPAISGVARTVGRIGTELAKRGAMVSYMSGQDHRRLRAGEVRLSALGVALLTSRRLSDADVVVLHGPMPTVTELVLAVHALRRRSRRTRLVYVHHFDVEFRFLGAPSILYNVVHHRLARFADRVVVTSLSYRSVLRGEVGDDVSVIPWGVDQLSSPGPPSTYDGGRPLRILFVGQQRGYKGISNLILAVAGESELELTVAGEGPLLRDHIDLVSRLCADNVSIVGRVTDDELDHLFASHDVIALPSITRVEAFGMVLLEGMRAGCVPVASDLPGVRDVVGHQGVLVAPRRIASLRDALVHLARRPDEVRMRSAAALDRSAQFTWDHTADRYVTVISEALGARP